MIQKLRIKFICVTMAIVTVLMAVIFGLVIHFTAQALERESLELLRSVASGRFQFASPEEGREMPPSPYFTVILSPLGQIVDLRGAYPVLEEDGWISDVLTTALESGAHSGVLEEFGLRFYRSGDLLSTQLVFADITAERSTLNKLTLSCFFIGLLGFAAFGAASFYLTGWMLRPVEAAWAEQRQFVADASHELKTPLTVIMTNAELLQNPGCSDAQRAQFGTSILAMSRQMRTLVENLLDLARVDNGSLQASFQRLDFSALCDEELLPWEPVFFEQGLTLDSSLEPGLWISGSAAHLRQVLNILLDNARKYSTPGGQVQLSLRRQGSWAELCVQNPGESITQDELQRIFQRFYRLDKVRTAGSGYGLGLPIAQGIVEQHAGKIWAESANGAVRFLVQLPISR